MKDQESIREIIEAIVDKQLKLNDPPETVKTYNRLLGTGMFTDQDIRSLISGTIRMELIHLIRDAQPFNQQRFIQNLERLPEPPKLEF